MEGLMQRFRTYPGRGARGTVVCLAAILSAGCANEVGPLHPVSGTVLLDGKPLKGKAGTVVLKPDPARGNTSRFEAVGAVHAEGTYTLFTKGKKGAPPGWYKVAVTAFEPGVAAEKYAAPAAPSPIPDRYANAEVSGLAIEVVAAPSAGAYDLALSP
jgi:hypothetical protein